MKKRLITLLIGMTLTAALVGGCSNKTTGASGANAGTSKKGEETKEIGLSGTLTIICPVKAGGDTDRNARTLADHLQRKLGINVIVKNVDGGATVMGMQECLDAKPDGMTLVVNGTDIFVPYMQGASQISIDSFKTIGIPIIDNTTVLAVNKESGWNTLEELLAASQKAPGKIEYGGKIGATNQICGVAMNKEWNAEFKFMDVGNNSAKMTALLAQQTDVINISYALAKDYFTTGEFIPVALLGAEKNPLLAEIPLADTYGLKNVDFSKFFWVGTHPDAPSEVVDKIAVAMEEVTNDPDFISTMENNYLTATWIGKEDARVFANGMFENALKPYEAEFLSNQ
jgi:tripartite-type tricarboxylate transporter receptor subunit TctC